MKKIVFFIAWVTFSAIACAYDNTYAIIIGVADYEKYSADDGDLKYTINDARLFYEFLKSGKGGSVPEENIVYLTDARAYKANIIAKGKALFAKAKKNDRVIFFFSGHGGKGCFVPYDAGEYGENYLYFSEIKSIFRCAESNTKLLFGDACFSGGMKEDKSKNIQKNLQKEIKASSKMNIAVMMSCRGNETSLESNGLEQGLFTYYLIKGLGGLANSDDNKFITIKELFYYVYQKTTEWAASSKHSQTPELFGNFDLRLIVANM